MLNVASNRKANRRLNSAAKRGKGPQQHKNPLLSCGFCSYQTRIERLYRRHEEKHSLDRPFQCPDCNLSDYNHSSFVDHLMDHQQTKILSCCYCQYRTSVPGMRLHIVKHRAIKPYDCSRCEFSSNHLTSLKSHVDLYHTKKFSCNICKKVMTKYLLLRHTKKVHGVKVAAASRGGEQFVAVQTTRVKDPIVVDEDESDSDSAEISETDLLPLKLPVPKVIIKRLADDLANDNVAEIEPSVPEISRMTEPAFAERRLSQESLTIEIPQTDIVDTIQSPDPVTDAIDLTIVKEEPLSDCEEAVDVKPDVDALVTSTKSRTPKTKFSCNDCSFATTKISLLRKHAPKHLLDQNLVCTDCDFKEPNTYIFAKHLDSQRNQGKLIHCCFCDYSAKSIQNMSGHLEKHKPVKLHDCPKCDQTLVSKSNLAEHYRNLHVNKTVCIDCGKRMTKYSLKKHRMVHQSEKQKIPARIAEAENHRTSSAYNAKPIFRCSECSYRTRMKSLLRLHAAKHLMSEADWICSFCDFRDSLPTRFASHLKQHSEAESFDCCFCDYSTVAVVNLARHLEVHRSVHFFDCSKCDKSFKQSSSVRKHYVTYHIEKHQCGECGEVMTLTKLLQHLKTHEVDFHEDVDQVGLKAYRNSDVANYLYQCEFCKFGTDIEELATKHVAKHTMDEAYFVCPVCQYRDNSRLSFAKHLISQCYGSPTCCFCDYTTTVDSYLVQHLEMHRSIHFYDCSKCDKSYTSRGSVSAHFKTFHTDTHTCMDCGEVITYYELLNHKKLHGTFTLAPAHTDKMDSNSAQELDPSMYHCYHCFYSTKKKHLLRRHVVKHLLDARLKCPICGFMENHAREFAKHCNSCQGGLDCCFCPFTTNTLTGLASHLETHRPVALYDCPECKHSSCVRSNIQEHYKKMHVLEYKCRYCDEFMSRFKYREHRLKHTMPMSVKSAPAEGPSSLSVSVCDPGSLQCGYCDYSTDIQSLLNRHIDKHQLNPTLSCPDCKFTESNTMEFAKHLRSHGEKDVFDCCFCHYSGLLCRNLANHLETHKSVYMFDCPKCDKDFSCKGNLKKHYQTFHVTEHVCPSCNEVVTYHKLLMHQEMHAEQENPHYRCNACTYKTKKKSLIRKHVNRHYIYVCHLCKHQKMYLDDFIAHMKTHGTAGFVECCTRKYSTSDISLVEHLAVHEVEFFDCSRCDKSFPNRSKLNEHTRQHHKDTHRCSICGQVMTYSRLIRHMKLHQSVVSSRLSKRFRCNHCVFTTKRKSLLRKHAPKHLIDNRLSCTICKYKTNVGWNFVAHLESHSSGILQCCHCDYSTTSKHNLVGHVDQHRPVHLHDCPKCDKSFLGSCGAYTLQSHYNKWHAQKHNCQKNIRKNVKCNQRMSLYRLQKHNLLMHTVAKEVPYYICRGPKSKQVAATAEVTDPMTNNGSETIEVVPDLIPENNWMKEIVYIED